MLTEKQYKQIKREPSFLTTYPFQHEGTLLILGSATGGMDELKKVLSYKPNAMIATVGHAAGYCKADFVISDHYEVIEQLKRLQRRFGNDHFNTHCTLCSSAWKWPHVDHWWNWRRSEATSVQTAIRIGLTTGFSEIILCGSPLRREEIQHPLQREKDGSEWPPPRNIKKHGGLPGLETSDEILRFVQQKFIQFSADWIGKVFSMSGFTRDILGPPPFLPESDKPKQRQQKIPKETARMVRMVKTKQRGIYYQNARRFIKTNR